jgi:AmmeMemoRadiSam system protein B
VVASGNLSHYVPKDRAYSESMAVLDRVCDLDVRGMYDVISAGNITACGYGPMAVAMGDCGSAKLLKYSDSSESLGTGGDVVGYASVALYR